MALQISRTARSRYGLDAELSWPTARPSEGDLPRLRAAADSLNRRAPAAGATAITGGELLAQSLIEEAVRERLEEAVAKRYPGEKWRSVLEAVEGASGTRLRDGLALYRAEFDSVEDPEARSLRGLALLWLAETIPGSGHIARRLQECELTARGLHAELAAALADLVLDEELELWVAGLAGGGGLRERLRYLLQSARSEQERLTLLAALDVLAEERHPAFHGGPGGEVEIPDFDLPAEARYANDADWMAGVVMVAKHVPVWLDQISRATGRTVERLDEVPNSELARLSRLGFDTLWLVGVWERSRASRWIKQLTGNPEAVASAYAIRRYQVAEAWGGQEALEGLRMLAARNGMRLAADMVPNHMGLDSDWVLEHPDRFLSLPACPFPQYRFPGPDLSPSTETGLYIESGYFDRSDAAVVFKRLDRASRDVRFIYHGNDGTGLPWNDTAQLNFLRRETREAVIAAIVEVARQFEVLRFDAAMTLARRHYQRLWFPPPGEGGAIASRAGHGVTAEEFDRLMPEEFWHEVVEAVEREAPGTLLVAEAFWLMENYFARQLGLHRVYNSAFMHLLRDGRTGELRDLVARTLAFDPRLLERYVNFLTNPDEQPASEQFGTGERYFGAATVLATFPGTPLFGHGQAEGLAERYGMEYARSYREEAPDPTVERRHRERLAPLLRRRADFAGSRGFELFEARVPGGGAVLDPILAYVTGGREDRLLVVLNNGPQPLHCRLERSVERLREGEPEASSRSLAEALGVGGDGPWELRDPEGRVATLDRDRLELELAAWECRTLGLRAPAAATIAPPREAPPSAPPSGRRRSWWRRLLDWLLGLLGRRP